VRTAYITTKVRPIRKLFVIEPNDFDSFEKVIKDISHDIEMIFNIFFENNNELFSETNREFVKRQNIDIIFNLSEQDNNKIEEYFSIECLTPNSDMTKIGRYVTDLHFISNTPSLIHKYSEISNDNALFFADKYNKDDAFSMISCVNFGLLIQNDDSDFLENSAFEDSELIAASTVSKVKEIIFDKEKHFCRLYNQINPFSSGYSSSIYEIDYAHPTYFSKGKYIFISPLNDLLGIFNFWNMRAAYPSGDFIWIAEENIEDYSSLFEEETIIIANNDKIKDQIFQIGLKNEILILDRLYFHGSSDNWKFYEHSQTISIANKEKVFFSHPLEKSFSELGISGACIIDIAGFKEFFYPNHSKIGNLFECEYSNNKLFPERFTHLYNHKISKYYIHFAPLEMRNLSIELRLPDFKEVIEFMFKSKNYTLKQTDKTSIFNQLNNAIGGIDEIKLFSSQVMFELLIKMTPKSRTDKIETLIKEIDNGNIELTPVIRTLKDILSMGEKSHKDLIQKTFQKLSDKKLLLRGKHFKCEHCSSLIWMPIENFNRINYCHACNNEVNLPITEEDKFRLNQLLVKAIDQGQLSTLLLLNFFIQNSGRNLEFLSNQEIYTDYNLQAFTDIDLIIKIGDKIGFAECKSTSGFDDKQIDDLLGISKTMKCDFIMLSSLQVHNDTSLQSTIQYIQTKNFDMPLFIFTKEVLFETKSVDFYSYFRRIDNVFQKGVIVLLPKKKS
jgi:hypothetical protein